MEDEKNQQSAEKALSRQEPEFMEIVRKRYLEKNADVALQIVEEHQKLKSALEKYDKWITRLEKGDTAVFADYKRRRKQLEEIDDLDF